MTRVEDRVRLAEFTEDLFTCGDIFLYDYCGSWMRGLYHAADGTWLCQVNDEMGKNSLRMLLQGELAEMLADIRNGGVKRVDVIVIDAEFIARAYDIGVAKWGEWWYDDSNMDAYNYDYVVQMAAFGELVFC